MAQAWSSVSHGFFTSQDQRDVTALAARLRELTVTGALLVRKLRGPSEAKPR